MCTLNCDSGSYGSYFNNLRIDSAKMTMDVIDFTVLK